MEPKTTKTRTTKALTTSLHPTTRALSSPSSVGSTTKQSVVSQASNPLKCLPPVILRTRKGDAQLAARTMIHWESIIATMCS